MERRHRASGEAAHGHGAAVPGGGDHRRRPARRRQGARGAAGAGVDAGIRCGALSHRDVVHHQGPRDRRAQHGHLSRPAQGDRPARRAHGFAHRRRRRLSALAEIPRPRRADAMRHRYRMRAGGGVHRPAEARRRAGRDGDRGRSRRPSDPHRQGGDHRRRGARRRRDRDRGADRSRAARAGRARSARATATWRSRTSTCRCG